MPATATRSPLAVAALAFVLDGVTTTGLVARFADAGATIDAETAAGLLDELGALGLARVSPGRDGDTSYLTPLGERVLGSTFAGSAEYADLLAEVERMRTDLLSTISHELRTPLTAVLTSVGLLLDPDLEPSDAEVHRLLETIQRNATRMQRVVGDILDLSRFRMGGVVLQLRRFDGVELARSAIASVAPLAERRGQSIDLSSGSGPVWVFGDYRRLEQAVVNLLSNAGKFSPDGSRIHVAVSAADDEVRWEVRDDGPGIKPADQARLFERFFVGRQDQTGADPGVGLGLPITLAIARAHGGRVDVESVPGRGSRFAIVVPAAGPDPDSVE